MRKIYIIYISILLLISTISCDEFVKIDPPQTVLVKTTVFQSDQTAEAAVLDIYYQLKTSGFASGSLFGISFLGSLLADEQINFFQGTPLTTAEIQQFNDNALQQGNSEVQRLWADLYKCIYKVNAVLEGVEGSTKMSSSKKDQLQGEMRFLRAFCYFYLVNLWGDVPLVISTDYRLNAQLGRTPKEAVYAQLIRDLKDAEVRLPSDYALFDDERVRATKWAAKALLARVYLYVEQWSDAEFQSTEVINNSALFEMSPNVSNVFNRNGNEAILQWWSDRRPSERATFRFVSFPTYGAISQDLIDEFEDGDLRESTWTNLTSAGYYRTLKYNTINDNPPSQYSTVIRLAELYLIRSEARANQNNFAGSQADINVIRSRGGLSDSFAGDKESLLLEIEKQRRLELFNEWGHRWFDLKRTGRAEIILATLKSDWASTDELLPIPEAEMVNNASLRNAQNPGY